MLAEPSRWAVRGLEFLAFTGLWPAAVAAALVAACSWALEPRAGLGQVTPLIGLASLGTLVVYNVDRLRDLELRWLLWLPELLGLKLLDIACLFVTI